MLASRHVGAATVTVRYGPVAGAPVAGSIRWCCAAPPRRQRLRRGAEVQLGTGTDLEQRAAQLDRSPARDEPGPCRARVVRGDLVEVAVVPGADEGVADRRSSSPPLHLAPASAAARCSRGSGDSRNVPPPIARALSRDSSEPARKRLASSSTRSITVSTTASATPRAVASATTRRMSVPMARRVATPAPEACGRRPHEELAPGPVPGGGVGVPIGLRRPRRGDRRRGRRPRAGQGGADGGARSDHGSGSGEVGGAAEVPEPPEHPVAGQRGHGTVGRLRPPRDRRPGEAWAAGVGPVAQQVLRIEHHGGHAKEASCAASECLRNAPCEAGRRGPPGGGLTRCGSSSGSS